jgi:hypothetical protein
MEVGSLWSEAGPRPKKERKRKKKRKEKPKTLSKK